MGGSLTSTTTTRTERMVESGRWELRGATRRAMSLLVQRVLASDDLGSHGAQNRPQEVPAWQATEGVAVGQSVPT